MTHALLIVDPHQDTREMYAEFFRHSGFDVVTVDNADAALAHAPKVDLVVTGILLRGETDGVQLVRRLRDGAPTANLPIIVLTACALPPQREIAEEAGCDAFLAKPCLPDVLLREVRRQLALAHESGRKRPPLKADVWDRSRRLRDKQRGLHHKKAG
jgi:CheY-like chemotaxis protein